MNPKIDDAGYMQIAIDYAQSGNPSPNPHVGAVIVSAQGSIVGRGFHLRRGLAHAEVMAIEKAGDRAIGSTLYVTLEPCNHQGRTPPCVDAIVAAKIARVVIGCKDPNPNVVGGGTRRLADCGIEVCELDHPQCIDLIRPFAKHACCGLPYVRLKLATSLDGRIATHTGVSKWITSEASRARAHQLRTIVDAVAVGIGTAIADDPELTARLHPLPSNRELAARVVFDTHGRLPLTSNLVQTANEVSTWLLAGERKLASSARGAFLEHAVKVIEVPCDRDDHLDLKAAIRALGQIDVVDLLIEGGAHLAGALVAQDCVDEIHWFTSPTFLGANALACLVGPHPDTPSEAASFDIAHCEAIDNNMYAILRRHVSAKS